MIYYLFELRDNATILDEYNALLSSRKKVYHVDIQIEGEQLYFTNDPPIQYTIIILWTLIIPTIVRNEENQEFSFEETERVITEYFCRWDENKIFFRKKWLRNALNRLLVMKWIKNVSPNKYQVTKTLNLQKNVTEIVSEKLAMLELSERKEKIKKDQQPKTVQINFDHFFRKKNKKSSKR